MIESQILVILLAFLLNAKAVFPSFKQRWGNSAHSYFGLFIKDAVPVHDTVRNNLNPSPGETDAEVITYEIDT